MWDRVYVSVWYGIIGLILLQEALSLLDRRDATPPLTNVLVNETPWWITMTVLIWLVVHFGSRYAVKHGILGGSVW